MGLFSVREKRRGPHPFFLSSILFALFILFFFTPGSVYFPSILDGHEGKEQALAPILKHAAEYCRKLSVAALDFICKEEIEEAYTVHFLTKSHSPMARFVRRKTKREKQKYLYDYQFVRKGNRRIEKRNLLEENGKSPKNEVNYLKTRMFVFKNVIFGPLNLLAEDRQMLFDFKMLENERLNGKNTLVIVAVPKPSTDLERFGGKIWIDANNFCILKIEWDSENANDVWSIRKAAERLQGEPQITQVTEFGYEKNGIRFPSRYFIEEAYITQKGKKVIHSETRVIYKDYKFFTVETEIAIK